MTFLVVLGMHRSGTSALTGVLSRCGFAAGKQLLPANEFNAHGYYEDVRLNICLDDLLKGMGRNWYDERALPATWLGSDAVVRATNELAEVMRAVKWTPNLGQVFKWDTVQRNGLPMSESKKRRVHPPEFKAKVGLEALGGMKTINQIAQEYGVHPIQVGQWKREIQAQAKSLFEGKRGPQPISAESAPERLYGEIGRLKMELDWLKKKSGISLP